MTKLIMMVGLPASGKSTFSKQIAEKEGALLLSSDELREELFGDVQHQDDNGLVFQTLYARTREALKKGQSVVLDATHLTAKRRMGVLAQFKGIQKIAYFLHIPVEVALQRDEQRARQAGKGTILRMFKNLQVPVMEEGWDDIHIIQGEEKSSWKGQKETLEDLIQSDVSHHELFEGLGEIQPFCEIKDLPHDSSYHSFSVSLHTYGVWKWMKEQVKDENRLAMLWAALFHDTGKKATKSFTNHKGETTPYASFIGHENVSAQWALRVLFGLGYEQEFVMKVVKIVLWHMRLSRVGEGEKGDQKLKSFVGEEMFQLLTVFRKGDQQAK